MPSGYTLMYRARFDKFPASRSHPWCPGYAWDWMVAEAAYRPTTVMVDGKSIPLRRGEFVHSIRYMAQKFGWPVTTTKRFLDRLSTGTETGTDIGTEVRKGITVVSICKYDEYQVSNDSGDAKVVRLPVRPRFETGTEKNEEKELNEGKSSWESTPSGGSLVNETSAHPRNSDDLFAVADVDAPDGIQDDRFEEFWKVYPHRNGPKGKAVARKRYAKAIKEKRVPPQVIIDGARAAHNDKDVRRGFARDPATWLNQEGWADEVDKPGYDANKERLAAWGIHEAKPYRPESEPWDSRPAKAAGKADLPAVQPSAEADASEDESPFCDDDTGGVGNLLSPLRAHGRGEL